MKTLCAVWLLIEDSDRARALRGMNFVRHLYIDRGIARQKYSAKLTLVKLVYAAKILIRGA